MSTVRLLLVAPMMKYELANRTSLWKDKGVLISCFEHCVQARPGSSVPIDIAIGKEPMNTEISEKNEILPLFKEYMHHMRQYFEIDNTDAWLSNAMSYLDSYATESDRHIFALKSSGIPIGFAMINNHLRFNQEGFAIAEFYIDTQHQTNGLGRELAEFVFSQFPGHWEVAVTRGNDNAQKFWRQSISNYTNGEYREWKIGTYDGSGFSLFNA